MRLREDGLPKIQTCAIRPDSARLRGGSAPILAPVRRQFSIPHLVATPSAGRSAGRIEWDDHRSGQWSAPTPSDAFIIIYPPEPNFQRPQHLSQACTPELKRRSPRRPTKPCWSFSRKPATGPHWNNFSVTPTRRCAATSPVSSALPSPTTFSKRLRSRSSASSGSCASPPSSAPGPSGSLRVLPSRISNTPAAGNPSTTHHLNTSLLSYPFLGEPPGEAFLTLLDHVSPASRAVLLLHYQHDLTLEESAAILEIPIGTAKSRLHYGVTTLRKYLTSERKPA